MIAFVAWLDQIAADDQSDPCGFILGSGVQRSAARCAPLNFPKTIRERFPAFSRPLEDRRSMSFPRAENHMVRLDILRAAYRK
jgi:hypothetical protein